MPSSESSNFYPRPPRGGRLHIVSGRFRLKVFLSTPSARRATCKLWGCGFSGDISIHALREEGDTMRPSRSWSAPDFYPRPPRGGRQIRQQLQAGLCQFLSTPSARRATCLHIVHGFILNISIHALREEGDVVYCYEVERRLYFYPRPPRGGRRVALPSSEPSQAISIHALREEGDSKNRDKISIFKQIIQHSARI